MTIFVEMFKINLKALQRLKIAAVHQRVLRKYLKGMSFGTVVIGDTSNNSSTPNITLSLKDDVTVFESPKDFHSFVVALEAVDKEIQSK